MKIIIDTKEITVSDEKLAIINRKLTTDKFLSEIEVAVNSTINQYALAGQAVIDKESEDEFRQRLELLKSADPTTIAAVDAALGYVK